MHPISHILNNSSTKRHVKHYKVPIIHSIPSHYILSPHLSTTCEFQRFNHAKTQSHQSPPNIFPIHLTIAIALYKAQFFMDKIITNASIGANLKYILHI